MKLHRKNEFLNEIHFIFSTLTNVPLNTPSFIYLQNKEKCTVYYYMEFWGVPFP